MPQLILLALVGAAAVYGYRSYKKESHRVSKRVREAEKEAKNHAHGTLVRDPETGEYRLRQD